MKRKKIMLTFGTRPEAIKMAPLYHSLKKNSNKFEVTICVTAQHRLMLDQVLETFDIVPDFDFNLMKSRQDLTDITVGVLSNFKDVFLKIKPDLMLVHGDTTTTLASSMACFYHGINIGHVEAGLRTYNKLAPFPEELNRQVVTRLADWHFAPTELNRSNLLSENVNGQSVFVTGNTVIDSLFWILNRIEREPDRKKSIEKCLNKKLGFEWTRKNFILITIHRRENFGDGFIEIFRAIQMLSIKFSEMHFVFPVHLNPQVQIPAKRILINLGNVHLIEPLVYEHFAYLLKCCNMVMTDSGGIQEEAPSLGKPVLVMRDLTERQEAVDAKTVRLVGSDKNNIVKNVSELLVDKKSYNLMSHTKNPYGDGKAAEKIILALESIYDI